VLQRQVELAQYTSKDFADACKTAGVRQSMSKVGSSTDNALAESFNATFKRETLQGRRAFTDEREARLTSFRWLHRYNRIRRQSKLGQQVPDQLREQHSSHASYAGASRMNPVSKIRGQGPGYAGSPRSRPPPARHPPRPAGGLVTRQRCDRRQARDEYRMIVELRFVPDCPNLKATRSTLAACLARPAWRCRSSNASAAAGHRQS
jgi:hypothetical protein